MKKARLSSLVSSLKTGLTLLQLANVIATGRKEVLMGAVRRGGKNRYRGDERRKKLCEDSVVGRTDRRRVKMRERGEHCKVKDRDSGLGVM